MRRLLICSDCFLPRWDGIARFLNDIIPDLPYEVGVIAPKFPGNLSVPYPVHRIPLSMLKVGDFRIAFPSTKQIAKIMQPYDLVWTHSIGPIGANAIGVASQLGKPVVSFVHSLDWELVPKSLSRWNPVQLIATHWANYRVRRCYNTSRTVMVPSDEVQELLQYKGVHTDFRRVNLGVRTEKFAPPLDKDQAKRNLGIDPNQTVIGYVGRLSREKDVETLLHAFSLVPGNACLLIVGDGLMTIKAKLNHPRIKYVGQQNNVIPYLQAMDIYVLPSLTETTSLSTLEAMSCGVVPVCTPVGLVQKYVREKENGLFFPMRNPFVLSLKLKWLMNDKEMLQKMSARARRTVEIGFSWQHTVTDCVRILGENHG